VGLDNSDITEEMRNYSATKFELACGLLHLGRALDFLHNNGMVHGNVSPQTIFITPAGQWKLGGFSFMQKSTSAAGVRFTCDRLRDMMPQEIVPRFPPPPSLYHCAPEMMQPPHVYNEKADLWALGALAFEMYLDSPIVATGGSEARERRRLSDWHAAACQASDSVSGTMPTDSEKIPHLLRPTLVRTLQVNVHQRPSAREFIDSAYFHQDGPMRTMIRVEGLLELADPQLQSQELTALQVPIVELPSRLQREMVLPIIAQLSRAPDLAPYCFPLMLAIARKLSQDEFRQCLSADLGAMMKPDSKILTGQMRLQIARHLSALVSVGDSSFVESHVLGALGYSLEWTNPQVVTAALKELVPAVTGLRVHLPIRRVETVVTSALGRLEKCAGQKEQHSSVRVHGLVALSGLLENDVISHEMLASSVFPLVQTCIKVDRSAGVIMAATGVLELCAKVAHAVQLGRNIPPSNAIITFL